MFLFFPPSICKRDRLWRMDTKAQGDYLEKRELISLGMWKLGRKHDSCLKIFGRDHLEEGAIYSLILWNGLQRWKLGEGQFDL